MISFKSVNLTSLQNIWKPNRKRVCCAVQMGYCSAFSCIKLRYPTKNSIQLQYSRIKWKELLEEGLKQMHSNTKAEMLKYSEHAASGGVESSAPS